MIDISDIDVFLGLDVGKGEHHATAVTAVGKKALDKRLPNSEPKLREVFTKLQAKHGVVFVVVDQPASIGALPLTVARAVGCHVAYLPGLTMRRISDLYPGEAKTDARDAFIIADAARAMPHTLRSIELDDERVAELEMLVGFDDDLVAEANRLSNRLRGLFTQVYPHLERAVGPRMQHPSWSCWSGSARRPGYARPGRRKVTTLMQPKAPRMAARLTEDVFTALDEQTVVVPGTEAAALIVPSLARSLTAVLDQRRLLEKRLDELLEAHPLSAVLTSMPGVGVRTAARLLIDVGDGTKFPVRCPPRRLCGPRPDDPQFGLFDPRRTALSQRKKQLERAFFLSAFAALSDPASRAYYDKKIKEGKHHTQSLLCLARRRADVLFAMLRDGTFNEPRAPHAMAP
ncbi:IS110 family transposase [Streptomyces sp. RS2]|uniref:IS110 family transposase n=1 Tax=Streptomyces sp. RS2 TaxID=1451205 RepID=UPI0021F84A91|nr:IS110 family transposase [Streptomyces sp. RS2]MCW1100265.1 IS110 family transposase [Streptomyces sp. RS2]